MTVAIARSATEPEAASRLDVVISALSSDAHTWNLVSVQLLLEELGHQVRNLGPCVPDEVVVRACRSQVPDLLVVASINGHGTRDGHSLIRAVRTCPGLASMPVVIGGVLGVDGFWHGEELLAVGFNAVFEGVDAGAAFRAYVNALAGTRYHQARR